MAKAKAKSKAKEKVRCQWCRSGNELYLEYHDHEWGVPVHDDQKQFEFLTLESAQAGLSWSTVLNKREGYRKAFANFVPAKVARFSDKKIAKLLENPGIIRNRLKVNAAVTNAQAFLDVQEEFDGFDCYIWQFVDGKPIQNKWKTMKQVPVTTNESDALSKDLKRRGFKFVGSTIIYAHMQAVGMVNDHTIDCFRHRQCAKLK
ncbi:MAG: DNA-3-methyladenine glycosylase I [Planctomycetota bacterium]